MDVLTVIVICVFAVFPALLISCGLAYWLAQSGVRAEAKADRARYEYKLAKLQMKKATLAADDSGISE